MDSLTTSVFWSGLLQIILINIALSGDNAVLIALAARSLPPVQRRRAILFGSGAAVAIRVALTAVAAWLLELPWLRVVGGLLLLWIGIHLISGHSEDEGQAKRQTSLWSAVRTILVADIVMSLENVIAVAAAAKGDLVLLILGLGISIPLVVFGSTLMIGLMRRFPWIVTLGAALIGWVAGETIVKDAALHNFLLAGGDWIHYMAAAVGAALVVAVGKALAARAHRAGPHGGGASDSN